MRLLSTWIVTLLLLPMLAFADLPGDEDPEYQRALAGWLSGQDDLATLKQFATLSANDNLAAQITLGLIARRPETYHQAIEGLPSGEYRSIFRKPYGRFGTRWMKVAAKSHPLAALLIDQSSKDYEGRAEALAKAGVIWEAIQTAQIPMNTGDTVGTIRALVHPSLLPYTKNYVLWFGNARARGNRLYGDSNKATEIEKLLAKVPPLSFKDRLLTLEMSDRIETENLATAGDILRLRGEAILLHPNLSPLTSMVRDSCPLDTSYHMGLLFHVGGSYNLQMAMISPLEPIVSTEEWQNSGRFRHEFFRLWRPNKTRRAEMRKLSECLARADQ